MASTKRSAVKQKADSLGVSPLMAPEKRRSRMRRLIISLVPPALTSKQFFEGRRSLKIEGATPAGRHPLMRTQARSGMAVAA
jgi:hypothetical protein